MRDPRELKSPEEKVEHLESALDIHARKAAQDSLSKLGGPLSSVNLVDFLQSCLRFPTVLQFDDQLLEAHQFAQPSFVERDGVKTCILHIRPQFEAQIEALPYIVAYMAGTINYLDAASSTLCEGFGAALMDVPLEEFYRNICRIADQNVG